MWVLIGIAVVLGTAAVVAAGVATAHALKSRGAPLPGQHARSGQQFPWSPDPMRITGASGYYTFTGPLGRPLPIGRPWGRRCQPVLFVASSSVPDDVYAQIADVVDQARAAGINVSAEDRAFGWRPGTLYYPPGVSTADVTRVGIFAHDTAPPRLANGHLSRVNLGWNAKPDIDGRHEDITLAKADFYMKALTGDPVAQRRSMRQTIAMTQGIMRTTRSDSGVALGSTVDRFSPADIAAMRVMSGCGNAALPR